MAACPSCGLENPEGFRFCGSCGAVLAAQTAAGARKTVTCLFCDLVGSTALGERTDPEVLRELMARYHAELRRILERHGGSVEKFVGDAAMAVFGIPHTHEDDALRAVRAAVEIKEAVAGLGLEARTGVNTGEVVAGAGETLVTGDAVNVAARLEQAAGTREILIGEGTERLVRGAVRVEPAGPVEVKGKAEPVPAFRLLEVLPDAPAFTRRIDAPFVGRTGELAVLEERLARADEERSPQLVTIVGAPGIGKSRLVREFVTHAGRRARVIVGRCLPYGEGITYWPLGEIVRQVAGAEPRAGVVELVGPEEGAFAADRLLGAIGLGAPGGSPEEIAWAARKLFEALARERSLVVVVDDIHWAEPVLLDLLEYVATFSAGASVLLLCTARAEVFEARPSWSNPHPYTTILSLQPLAVEEAAALVGELDDVDPGTRERIVAAAEGNPLFVEQLLAMRAETPDGELAIPPTIQALLAARLDRLEPSERDVVERASIEGRLFHRTAVAELLPPAARPDLGSHLLTLVRKEFIRPDRAVFLGDDGFRFGHVLIRDTAYESMPKRLRAELHERFAGWLEAKLGERAEEYDEIVGYHLEQASRYAAELGAADGALARRAAGKLGASGRRAFARSDMAGATNLLERAVALLDEENPRRFELEIDLGEALLEAGRLGDAASLLTGATRRADTRPNRLLSARAEIGLAFVRLLTEGSGSHAELLRDIEPLVEPFEEASDHHGAADALRLIGLLVSSDPRYRRNGLDLHERALGHARAAGDERREAASLRFIVSEAFWGEEHVEPALRRCRGVLDATTDRRLRANCLVRIGGLHGLAGRYDEARAAIGQGRATMDEFGLRHLRAHSTDVLVLIELLAGNHELAEREAREAFAVLVEMEDRTYAAALARWVAQALEEQARLDEADEWLGVADEFDTVYPELGIRAQLMARRGRLDEAERLARAALDRGDEYPVPQFGDPRLLLADVLLRTGRTDEGRAEAERCLRRYEAKGIVRLAETARALLDEAGSA